jgi:hypothetical protein
MTRRHFPLIGAAALLLCLVAACRQAPVPIAGPPPSPTAALIPPLPSPTPTPDPTLPDWTILVYLAAGDLRAAAALQDLNEMEAAGETPRVNLLAQIDPAPGAEDGGARRYLVRADTDPQQFNGELLAELAPAAGDATAVLADFLTWGVTNYPAHRYALLLSAPGGGREGVDLGGDAFLTPDGLAAALADAPARLQLLALDGAFLGQLDLLHAVQPFVDVVVAAPGPTPAAAWNYQLTLAQLFAAPEIDARQLAAQLVSDFVNVYTQLEGDPTVSMAAFDLARLPTVALALEGLAAQLAADPAGAEVLRAARVAVEDYGRPLGVRHPAVDLAHLAALAAQISAAPEVQSAAQALQTAVAATVLAFDYGPLFDGGGGLAVYFPFAPDPAYVPAAGLAAWGDLLALHAAAPPAAVPQVSIVDALRTEVSIQRPTYLDGQAVGPDLARVWRVGGLVEPDGRRRLLRLEPVAWAPRGLFTDTWLWDPLGDYLSDSAGRGGFVAFMPLAPDSSLAGVRGSFQRAGAAGMSEALLVVARATGARKRLWVWPASVGGAVVEATPQSGDSFQLTDLYLDADGRIISTPGGALVFDDAGQFTPARAPLPDGAYFTGLLAEDAGGAAAVALIELTLQDDAAPESGRAYLEPRDGFQFVYPLDWAPPEAVDGRWESRSPSGSTILQVSRLPDLPAESDAAALQAQALEAFGGVDMLFVEETAVADLPALRAAYGYADAAGAARTGLLLTFVHDNAGYVVDVDGPQSEEAATIRALDNLAAGWQFVPPAGAAADAWRRLAVDGLLVGQPPGFDYRPTESWRRFVADGPAFIALRAQPQSRPVAESLAALRRNAGQGLADFAPQPAAPRVLGMRTWLLAEFGYTAVSGAPVQGFIAVSAVDGRQIAAWAEAPADAYPARLSDVFLTLLASLQAD